MCEIIFENDHIGILVLHCQLLEKVKNEFGYFRIQNIISNVIYPELFKIGRKKSNSRGGNNTFLKRIDL